MHGWKRAAGMLAAALPGVIAGIGLWLLSRVDLALFHSLATLYCVIVGATICVIGWNARAYLRNGYLLFIIAAWPAAIALDLLHVLLSPAGVGTAARPLVGEELCVGGRLLEAISLIIAPLVMKRRVRPTPVSLAFVAAAALLLLVSLHWGLLPAFRIDGAVPTPFRLVTGLTLTAGFLIATGLLWRRRSGFDAVVFQSLAGALALRAGAEALAVAQPFAGVNAMSGALLARVASQYLVYRGLIQTSVIEPHAILFRELQQRKEKLHTLSARYQAILDAVPDLIVEVDRAKRMTWLNKTARQFFGEGALGREAAEYFEGEQDTYAAVQPLFEGSENVHYVESWQRRQDGEKRLLAWWCRVLKDQEGLPVGALSTARDITDQRRAETALLASQTRFQALFESMTDPVALYEMVYNAAGEPTDYRVLDVNPACERAVGLPRDRIVGATMSSLCGTGTAPHLDIAASVAETGRPVGLSYHHEPRRLHLSVSCFSPEKGKLAAVFADVSERKRVEEAVLKAKEAADAANRAKGEFLANTSHEIRTPMNAIIGMTDLVLETELAPLQREYVAVIRNSAEALLTLINDVLDFSRIEAGQLTLEAIEFGLRDLVGQALASIQIQAGRKGLAVGHEIDVEAPDRLVGDPVRTRQVLINLLANAVKFTHQGRIDLRVTVLSEHQDHVLLEFSVADTGVGVPPEKQGLIFESFQQADGSTTREYGGTGLGLSVSKKLVTLMGGRIWVESAAGRGSVFRFTLPLGRPGATMLPGVGSESVELAGLPVLIVSTSAERVVGLRHLLQSWGAVPTVVDSGPAALVLLDQASQDQQPYELAVFDGQPPELDSFALAEKTRANTRLCGMKTLMLAAVGQRGDAARCRQLGVGGYLAGPIEEQGLRSMIEAVLGAGTDRNAPELITRHSLREARGRLTLLLVESPPGDGEAAPGNPEATPRAQEAAGRLLEKWGHRVSRARGRQGVLAALEQMRFDALLLDVGSPAADGPAICAAIREREERTGGHLPIIAIDAAHATGARPAAGEGLVDARIASPVSPADLATALANLCDRRPRDRAA
jgi:PAS domain S-box-containing protein